MIKGIDISHWNHPDVIRQNRDKIDFVMMKASEGRSYADRTAPKFAEEALAMDKLIGFYHYARPESGSTPEQEAQNFLSRIRSYVDAHKCVMALDWEGKAHKCSIDWAIRWLDYIRNVTGVSPMFYTSQSELSKYGKIAEKDYGLWVAKWIKGATLDKIPESRPDKHAWSVWAIWQYSNGNGYLDYDVFNGNRKQFKKYM